MKLVFLLIALISSVSAFPLLKRALSELSFFENLGGKSVGFYLENRLNLTVDLSCTCTYKTRHHSRVQNETTTIEGHTDVDHAPNLIRLIAPKGSSMVCDITCPSSDENWNGFRAINIDAEVVYQIERGAITIRG